MWIGRNHALAGGATDFAGVSGLNPPTNFQEYRVMASGLFAPPRSRRVQLSEVKKLQRSHVIQFVVTVALAVCGFRLAQLQLVQGAHHRSLAEQNRIARIPIPADRGNIVDRKGLLLAANRLTRSVYLSPREKTDAEWAAIAPALGEALNIPPAEILSKLKQAGYHSTMPVRILRDLSPAAFVALQEQVGPTSGIEVRAESNRQYPNGAIAAHVLGYIGEATIEDLKAHPDYPMGMIVGQMGIERIANTALAGQWGSMQMEVNAKGQPVKRLGNQPPLSGLPVKLTLDLALQKTAEVALANRRGAVVVLNPKTGEILALASGPTFDPNWFTRRISGREWQQLQSTEKPFLNRALQGYPPGSTFKIITATAGMESGKFSPDAVLPTFGAINIGGTLFHEHGGGGYGTIGFREAFAYSSNTFFYQVGMAAGPEQIATWGHRLGIGEVKLDLDGGSHGIIPTPAQKQKLYGESWYVGDTVTMAIGQGLVQVTPLEMATVVSVIANGGWRVKPHLLASQTATFKPEKTGMHPETIAAIRSGLIAVVQQGTARQLNDGSIPPTAGKTGTAEVPGQRDNAVYVGFGPVNKPEIAVAVVVENGGFGAESAVPIAHEIYKTYFKSRR